MKTHRLPALTLLLVPALLLAAGATAGAGDNKPFTQEFKTDEGYTIRLTEDWKEVPADVVRQANEKMSGLTGTQQNWAHAYQLKQTAQWLVYPYILVKFIPGRQSEQTFRKQFEDKDEMQKGVDSVTKKVPSLIGPGTSFGNTSYNVADHSGEVISQMNITDIGAIVGYTGIKLTDKGVIQFCGYCAADKQEVMLPFFRSAFANMQVSGDLAYKPGMLDGIPILEKIDFSSIGNSTITGGIIGGVIGLLSTLAKRFKKKKA